MEEGPNAEDVCISEGDSTHIVFDGKQVHISPNISIIFNFLIEIEKESESIFGMEKRLEECRQYYADLLNCTNTLLQKLKREDLGNIYTFEKDPRNFTELLNYVVPVRPQMITLFTQLEVMYFLILWRWMERTS